MKIDWQLIAVGVILLLAAIRIIVGIVRAIRRPSCSSGCSGCDKCPLGKKNGK